VILKTLKALAKDMGIEIVVEGIENQEQLGLLRDMGFGLVQGYYLSRPLAASEIPELLGGA
jgi:EAL domain-containing protein (putative c-di-GMP-specific phosphodiesterase class I)